MVEFAVVLAVGPGQQELDRTADLLESLWTYEAHTSWTIFVTKEDRQLTNHFYCPSTCKVVSLVNPFQNSGFKGGHRGGLCTATLTALRWIHENTSISFAVKLDTDALVIAPFAEKIHNAFASFPNAGILGSYDKTCNGDKRDFSYWAPYFKKLSSPISVFRATKSSKRLHLHIGLLGRPAIRRKHIQAALRNGYEFGEHCQGGAYAISKEMISNMAVKGYLEDPLLWLNTPITEDTMMGMYAKGTGMQLQGLVEQDQPFGIRLRGLADTPENLLSRGYSLIHSIKNDKRFSENEIRRFYREYRLSSNSK